MGHNESYESKIKGVYMGMLLLGFVTLVEVGISLLGKGHLMAVPENAMWFIGLIAILLIGLSLYKAYFIIYEFMHMGHEVKGLRMTVLMPVLLLVWAVVAFFHEGDAWKNRRNKILKKNAIDANDIKSGKTGMLYEHPDWKDNQSDS